jgi:arylsulfatase A-like enzyme
VEPARPPPVSVLLITAEGWRRDHMSAYGYPRETTPRLDAFYAQSVVLERLWSPIAASAPAHASLLTATYPSRHGLTAMGVPKAPLETSDARRTAAELLAAQGYACNAYVTLDTVAARSGLGAGFVFVDEPAELPPDPNQLALRASRWLELQGSKRPFFLWLHFKGGCEPNAPPPPFSKAFAADAALAARLDGFGVDWSRFDLGFNRLLKIRMFSPELEGSVDPRGARLPPVDRAAFERLHDRYDGDLRATDAAIGDVLDRLDALGLAPRTLVVFAAAYGQSLGERTEIGHGELNRENLLATAAFRAPGAAPKRLDELASLVDVLPTALACAGLAAGARLAAQGDGRDLTPEGEQRDAVLAERATREQEKNSPGPQWALITPEWKLVHRPELTDALFDLRADPEEARNVAAEHPIVARELLAQLRELRGR